MTEYRKLASHPTPRQAATSPKFWKPPPPDWYKMNVDAAVFAEAGQCGLGVVIRNDRGQLMGALSKMLPYPLGAMEAEAKAVECGIIFAWELGLRQVIVEGDSQVVVHALNRRTNTPLPIQQIILGAQTWLPNFRSWKAIFAQRDCNKAAHLMARHAKDIVDCLIWVEDTPPPIVSQIQSDVISLSLTHVE